MTKQSPPSFITAPATSSSPPLIPELFTVAQAAALLQTTEPRILADIVALLPPPAPPSEWVRRSDATDVWYENLRTRETSWDAQPGLA